MEVPVGYGVAHQLTHHRRVGLGGEGGTTGSPSPLIPRKSPHPTHSSSLPGKVQHTGRVGMIGHEEGDQEGQQLVLHGVPDGLGGVGEGWGRGGGESENHKHQCECWRSERHLPTLDCRTPKRRMSGQCFRGKLNSW